MEILFGIVFSLLTGGTALAFPKLMGILIDCVKNNDLSKANSIALGLVGILFLQSFFRISLFVNYTEIHWQIYDWHCIVI